MPKLTLPPLIVWRDGRPRFVPGPNARKLGFTSHDLRSPDGAWMKHEEACEAGWKLFAELLAARGYDAEQQIVLIAHARKGGQLNNYPKPNGKPRRRNGAPVPAERARGSAVEDLIEDWLHAIAAESDPLFMLAPDTIESYRKAVVPLLYRPETRGEAKDRRERTRAAELLGLPLPERTRETFAQAPVALIDGVVLTGVFKTLSHQRGPHTARAAIAAFSAAWTWGRAQHRWRLGVNPSHDLRLPRPEGRIVVFTNAEIRALLAAADALGRPSIGDSVMLGLFTCQRQRDRLLLIDEGLVEGRRIFRQSKTKKLVPVKETPQLAERLADARARSAAIKLKLGIRPDAMPIVVDEGSGMAYDETTYRHWFATVRAAAIEGIVDHAATAHARRNGRNDPEPVWRVVPCPSLVIGHDEDGKPNYKRDQDLRDTAITWLALAGLSLLEICAISGHSPKSVQTIIEHYLGDTRALADSGIDKLVAWMQREGMAV